MNTRNKDKLVAYNWWLFLGQGIRLYNKVPSSVQRLSVSEFKFTVKRNFIGKGYSKLSDYMDDNGLWK